MRGKLPFILLGVIALMYAALIVTQPAPLDWRPDYRGDSSLPLGADVLRAILPVTLAPAAGAAPPVRDIAAPPFMHLGAPRGDTTYVFITQRFEPDEAEAMRLLAHVRRGATVFVAAHLFEGPLSEGLGSHAPAKQGWRETLHVEWRGLAGTRDDSLLHFTAPGLRRADGFRFPFPVAEAVLDGLDSVSTQVLATGYGGEPVLARIAHGRGAFVVSSTPDAFSNAALMGSDGQATDAPAFLAGVLAYLPAGPAFWDEYVKPRRAESGSPLRFVLSRPPLRLAYGLTLLGVLMYVIFRGRRWQRSIPVVAPPPNATVEFVRTLGRLHFQHGDHAALARRRARYAVDRMRTRLGVTDADLSPDTEARLVRRGVPPEVASAAFARLRGLTETGRVDADDLVELDRVLERFWKAAG
jgi:hypothetical protein